MGFNQYNIDNNRKNIHAECDAINKLNHRLFRLKYSRKKASPQRKTPVDIYIYRTNKSGSDLLMAKPCDNCLKKIMSRANYQVHPIYFTNDYGEIVRLKE